MPNLGTKPPNKRVAELTEELIDEIRTSSDNGALLISKIAYLMAQNEMLTERINELSKK
jgi:hypothetical protein